MILRLCSRAALSVKELSVLLDRSEAYVEDAIRPLITNGSLARSGTDQSGSHQTKYASTGNYAELAAAEPPTERDRRIPNLWTNVAYVVLIGLLLGFTRTPVWLLFAIAASAALAWWHVSANSQQYRRFRALLPRRARPAEFMLLKSAVTVIEIAIVYLVTAAGF